jgi:hypothetical protein
MTSSARWLPPLLHGLSAMATFGIVVATAPLWRRLRRGDGLDARPGDNGLD